MKEEDFNKIILEKALSEHQKDLINMAKKGWELHYYKTEESKEKWFESCYTLYKDASFNYINFKMTLANRLKMLRFREESLAREDANLRNHNSRYQEITEQVQSYFYDLSPFDTLDNEESLIYDISEEVFKLYAKKIKFKNKKKNLKIKKASQSCASC